VDENLIKSRAITHKNKQKNKLFIISKSKGYSNSSNILCSNPHYVQRMLKYAVNIHSKNMNCEGC